MNPEQDLLFEILDATREPGARMTQDELAAFLGMNVKSVRLLESKALRKLRAKMKDLGLRESDALRELSEKSEARKTLRSRDAAQ